MQVSAEIDPHISSFGREKTMYLRDRPDLCVDGFEKQLHRNPFRMPDLARYRGSAQLHITAQHGEMIGDAVMRFL